MGSEKRQDVCVNQQQDALKASTVKRGLPIDQQRQDLLDDVAQQQDEGEDKHRHAQRRQHLAAQVSVQRFHC